MGSIIYIYIYIYIRISMLPNYMGWIIVSFKNYFILKYHNYIKNKKILTFSFIRGVIIIYN